MLLVVLILLYGSVVSAEPAYCTLEGLKEREIALKAKLKRGRAFKLGDTVVAGFGVGQTKIAETKKMSEAYSKSQNHKWCTFYFNRQNPQAEKNFVHNYVPKPMDELDTQEYMRKVSPLFYRAPVNFSDCARDHKYIGLGCNGQRHRGPTAFGMLLAFSGCNPETVNRAVNGIWDLNGVNPAIRLDAIKNAYWHGIAHPIESKKLRSSFGG